MYKFKTERKSTSVICFRTKLGSNVISTCEIYAHPFENLCLFSKRQVFWVETQPSVNRGRLEPSDKPSNPEFGEYVPLFEQCNVPPVGLLVSPKP